MKKHLSILLLSGLAAAIPLPVMANAAVTVMMVAMVTNKEPSCEQKYAQCIRASGGDADPAAAVQRMQAEWAQEARAAQKKREQLARDLELKDKREAELKAKREAERTELEKQIAEKWKDVKILRPN